MSSFGTDRVVSPSTRFPPTTRGSSACILHYKCPSHCGRHFLLFAVFPLPVDARPPASFPIIPLIDRNLACHEAFLYLWKTPFWLFLCLFFVAFHFYKEFSSRHMSQVGMWSQCCFFNAHEGMFSKTLVKYHALTRDRKRIATRNSSMFLKEKSY